MFRTRAKFSCESVSHQTHGTQWSFGAVYHDNDPEHENSKFNQASPNGKFTMFVDKDHYQGEHPVPGREYYFDISEVPVPVEDAQEKATPAASEA